MRRVGLLLLIAVPGCVFLLFPYSSPHLLHGTVRGPNGPVPAAQLRWKGHPDVTRSDRLGRFAIPQFAGARRLTAWAPGHFISGIFPSGSGETLLLTRIPQDDNPDYTWIDPTPNQQDETRCGNCHPEIFRQWSQTGHARSVNNPRFQALYQGSGPTWSLLDEHPDGAGVCASCHAPTLAENDPAVYALHKIRGVSSQGVHCDFCHKIAGPESGQVGLAHGKFGLRLLRPKQGQLFFGPLDDVDRGEDVYSEFQRDSRFCASCHEGILFGVHVYSTYSEWQKSPAAQAGIHCQSCHMKPTGRMTNIAPGHGGIERNPATLGNHHFWHDSQTSMLQRCLQLTVHHRQEKDRIVLAVSLQARNVGHRVPTGFVDRQLILHVVGLRHGQPVRAVFGPRLTDATGKPLRGQTGRLYAKQLRDDRGRTPVPFWQATEELADTRLLPGQPDEFAVHFPTGITAVRIQILHRRFWEVTNRQKGWPNQDIVVLDREFQID